MPGGHASHWMSAQSSTGDPVVLLFPDELFESLSPLLLSELLALLLSLPELPSELLELLFGAVEFTI